MICLLTAGVSSPSPAVPNTLPSVALQLSTPVLPSSDLAFCVLFPLAVTSHLFIELTSKHRIFLVPLFAG